MRPATSEFCLFRCLNRYLNEYSFKLLENMCDVTPLTSAIDSGGSEKEKKKVPIFFAGFGCPRLYHIASGTRKCQ